MEEKQVPHVSNSIDKQIYQQWFERITAEIDRQRLKAAIQLNAATLQHYWWMGCSILSKQKEQGWGAKVIDLLSKDLQTRYGKDCGYSIRNLKYMRQFAGEYPDFPFVQVPLAQLSEFSFLQDRLSKFTVTADGHFVQVPLAQITWYHHISLLPKIKTKALRAFYITEAANQGWSADMMLAQIADEYHAKVEALPNNFADTLPSSHSDLAKSIFKDPYNLSFIDMQKVKQERDLEDQLTTKITDFLLELGKGFAYVGRQYPLDVAGDECKIDLLMYHLRMHCYVAIELKVVEFIPEFISKLNYYISAVDDFLKAPQDNPTIGLLLCRSKNNTKVEFALRGMTQPLGVATYETKKIMDELRSSFPTIEELEAKLKNEEY